MSLLELFVIAVGLSMDAFAVSLCKGLSLSKIRFRSALCVGLYFGIFQAGMPLIGYFLGTQFADKIAAYDHWIAFILLVVIGGKMIKESFESKTCEGQERNNSLHVAVMLPLAVATSIDALAVGVSFAFLKVSIIPAVCFIGTITFVFSMLGMKLGNLFGVKYQSKAERMGGGILVLMGIKILLEHLGLLPF